MITNYKIAPEQGEQIRKKVRSFFESRKRENRNLSNKFSSETFDKELVLRCSCDDPFHIIWFGFTNRTEQWPADLHIEFRAFHGSLWNRIKAAVRLIFSGWLSIYPDVATTEDDIKKLRDFCEICILESGDSEQETGLKPTPRSTSSVADSIPASKPSDCHER
jgi:hypothetical protein